MKHLIAITFCLCLIAALTPAVSATVYWNFTAGINAGYGNATIYNGVPFSVDYGPAGINSVANQTCMVTGRRFWYLAYHIVNNSEYQKAADYAVTQTSSTPNGTWDTLGSNDDVRIYLTCSNDGTNVHQVYLAYHTYGGEIPAITADFNATPISGQAPLYVAFQDNSTGGYGAKTHNWSVSPDTGVIGEESTSEYPTFAFTQNGNYSITHCISDGTRSDCETKNDLISVYNSSATATTTFWAVDPLGHRVYDSAISLQDVQNSSWTNTSSPSGGVATIISLIGHTINGYATAAGYNDGETLGITADGVNGGIILMTPTNTTNVSAGYVTLYVYAKEAVGNAPIPGAYINIAYASGGSTTNDGGTTSSDGIASFTVPNKTLIYIYGEKAGYNKVSTTKDSGTGSGGSASVNTIMYLSRITVTTVPTATTLPGGGTPTTTVTVDPRTSAEKQEDMANILLDYGDELVLFFIVLTIVGGVKLIGK